MFVCQTAPYYQAQRYNSNCFLLPIYIEKRRYCGGLNFKSKKTICTGITNDSKDPSVDTFKSTTLPILKRFGVPSEGLEIKVESRGLPPNGGGEVLLSVPVVQSLTVRLWIFDNLI